MKFVSAVFLSLGLSATSVYAECLLGDEPTIPDGATSSYDDMIAAKGEVDAYMAVSNDFLSCLESENEAAIDGMDKDAAAEMTAAMAEKHNAAVEMQEKVAGAFNQAIRDYKAANPQ